MFEQVKQEIDDKIKTNGNNEITANRLNGVLQDMMDASAEVIGEVQQSIGDQVEANPTGEATETLRKIKIGETKYNIPQTDTSNLATKQELQQGLGGKQDIISDLQQIRTRADEGHTALQPIQDATPNNFVIFDENGRIKNSGKKDTDFATAAQGTKADNAIPMPTGTDGQILEKDSNETSGVKWVNKPSDGQDGASAYELYEQAEIAAGRTPLSQEAWLASLKANIGEFLFVPTDAAAVTAMATIGQTYSSAIDPQGKNVAPSQNTLSVILLMNDDATTPTKTMMIATQDDGSSGFEFVYAGDLQSAMPSNVLTQANIVNDLTTGGTTDVASAETVKNLNTDKLDRQKKEISYEYTSIFSESGYPKIGYLNTNGTEGTLPDDSKFRIDKFSVTVGNTYYITGKEGSSTSNALAAFYDSNGDLIADSQIEKGVANASASRMEVTAPTGASYIKVMTNNYEGDFNAKCETRTEIVTILQDNQDIIDSVGDVADLHTTEKTTVVDAINEVANNLGEVEELDGRVNSLETTVGAISSTEPTTNKFDKNTMTFYGYINSTTGLVDSSVSQKNKRYGSVEVLPNHFYYLAGRDTSNASIKPVRCVTDINPNTPIKVLSVNGEEITSYNLPSVQGSTSSWNGQFKTPALPDGATKLYFQFTMIISDIGSIEHVMLLDVGEEYDPNFTVEEPVTAANYIPFGTRTVVKEDALPSSMLGMQDDVQQALTAANGANTKSEDALRRKYKLKLLLVGSSHGMNTIAQLPWIAYKSGIDIEVGNVYIGSMSLQRLVGYIERNEKVNTVGWFKIFKNGAWIENSNIYFKDVFSYTDWDFISLQMSAGETWTNTQAEAEAEDGILDKNYSPNEPHHPNPVYLSHNDALQYVLDCIRNNVTNNPKILFNSGFATPMFSKSTEQQTAETIGSVKEMKEQFGIDYYSTAVAVQNARNTYLRHIGYYAGNSDANKNNNLVYDGQHLDFGIGCYVASVCLLEYICRILGWSVLNYKYYGSASEIGQFNQNATLYPERYTEPTDETMIVAKACAMCACDTPDTPSTKLSDRFKWQIAYNLSNGITASNTKGYCGNLDTYSTTLNGTVSSVVITSKPWDRTQPSTTLVEGTDYTYDSSTGKIVIGSVQGDITITAS